MAMLTEYSPTLTRLLATPPPVGEGHRWMFRVALHLRHYHPREACRAFLRRACDQCIKHRAIPDREIEAALTDAFNFMSDGTPGHGALDWFEPDPVRIGAVAARTRPLFDPAARTGIAAAAAIPHLFRRDELVCLASTQANSVVLPAPEALGLADTAQFIVPSPMRAAQGVNKAGKVTARCDSNVLRRRHLVLEFDGLDKPTQAAVLAHLAGILPLVLAVDSAGKSIHGWFRVEGLADYELRNFMCYAIGLGADPHTWVRSQLVRCPGGLRYREGAPAARQEVVYWGAAHA